MIACVSEGEGIHEGNTGKANRRIADVSTVSLACSIENLHKYIKHNTHTHTHTHIYIYIEREREREERGERREERGERS